MNTPATMPQASPADRLAAIKRAIPIVRMLDYGMSGEDARRLAGLEPDQESWDLCAEDLGDAHLGKALRLEAAGQFASAGIAREQAAAAFNIGQLSLNVDTPRKAELYARATEVLTEQASGQWSDFRRLALPTGDGATLFGWELPVEDALGAVVVVGGLSGWGSSFFALARALTRRRIAVILAEGPGQGETRLVSQRFLRPETLGLFDPIVAHARRYSDRVGLFGNSFGGLVAAHLAAGEGEIAACCINCSPLRLRRPEHAAELEQIGAAFGAQGETLFALIDAFNLDPARQRIECPVFVLEGGADPVVPVGSQMDMLESMTALPVAFRQWADGFHTLYNHAPERNALVSAWFTDRFEIARKKGAALARV